MGKRIYSEEFRQEALRRVRDSGVTVSQVARDLGVKQQTLQRWQQLESRTGPRSEGEAAGPGELARLRRENLRLRAERDILKKAIGYFAKEPK